MFSSRRGLGRLRWIVLGGVLLLVAGAAAAAVVPTSAPGDVSHPDVDFTQDEPQAPAPPPSTGRTDSAHPFDDGFAWPVYGYTKQRTSWLALDRTLRLPFAQEWAVTGRVLTEFTPVLCGRSLYQHKDNGALYAMSRVSGRGR
jgi:hypothetical protein